MFISPEREVTVEEAAAVMFKMVDQGVDMDVALSSTAVLSFFTEEELEEAYLDIITSN